MAGITRSAAKAKLGDVPEGKRFWCHDGRVLKNLQELEAALRHMDEATFRYHSNETKTDFSNWVRDVIGEEKLARELIGCPSAAAAAEKVAKRLRWLKRYAGMP